MIWAEMSELIPEIAANPNTILFSFAIGVKSLSDLFISGALTITPNLAIL